MTIVTLEPGARLIFKNNEHGTWLVTTLEGKGVYRLGEDWVEVEAVATSCGCVPLSASLLCQNCSRVILVVCSIKIYRHPQLPRFV